MNQVYFHGDVQLKPVDKLPSDLTKVQPRIAKKSPISRPDLILAEGEMTGHAHRIACKPEEAELFSDNLGSLYLLVKQSVHLAHEEHNPVLIPPGQYKVSQQREFDYEAQMSRMVAD